jgi:flagellar basal-body rod modification protein FlgD
MTESITNTASSTYDSYSQTTKSSSEIGKDQFLKLLTYQLKSQNPLKPYDNQEFATQLAQFSQLETLTDIRSLLEDQINSNLLLTQTISNSALPGLLGKYAKAISNTANYDGSNAVQLGYNLDITGSSGELAIKDSSGKVVRTIQLTGSELDSGDHKISWDGKDDSGNDLEAGEYTFNVSVKDKSGTSYTPDCYTYGIIEAVRFKSEGTMLVINGLEIPLGNVTDISTES